MKKYILISLVLFSSHLYSGLVTKIYCYMFGNNDVRECYRREVSQALKDMGVSGYLCVPIKKMNNVGPYIAAAPLSSFTALGIWLNEEFFNICSEKERTYYLYHEAAHYALRHHQKVLVGGFVGSFMATVSMGVAYNRLSKTQSSHPLLKSFGVGGALSMVYAAILPRLIKVQEKQADLLAAKTLIKFGRKDVVIEHIERLKMFKNGSGLWWYPPEEQLKYLEELL